MNMPDFTHIWPEIFVASMACLVLIVDLYTDKRREIVYWLSMLTLVGAALITLSVPAPVRTLSMSNTFVAEPLTDVLKMVAYAVVALVFLYSRDYLRVRELLKGEYFVLGLFGLLGIMVMISAHNFITLYLGLELLSLSLYAMVAFDRESSISAESAMKYFVLGAIASGTLLYGMSLVYGATGSLDLAVVANSVSANPESMSLMIALAFLLVGIAFKLGAVPFHMWLPDVYHGAPTSTTLYIGTASKIAAFALVIRLLAEGFIGLETAWRDMLMVMAVLSLAIGNIVAIAQTNLKRMLAYSTISHIGFILLGFVAADTQGFQAALFYTIVYVLMAAGAFGMIILLSRAGFEADELSDFKGLNQYSPWFALIMLLLMFSMAGVPPLIGFYAKLAVISAVINAGYIWLAIAAVVFSVIGAFYYLRVIKLMYFDAPEGTPSIDAALGMRVVLSANGLAMIALGVFPGALLALCGLVIPVGLR
ncbi:MAG: NADH-quinone oxidoreductase subunit NuoN [Gammaproteobacteria bacterium]|nr:NADH-quinone oxidoreductase subunit NuoN [Gammaproteobacteria bacterium]MDH3767678.1 NADH-quinone oxidoreductase subunit NuoN [Gammaproteobacteria bacterium]